MAEETFGNAKQRDLAQVGYPADVVAYNLTAGAALQVGSVYVGKVLAVYMAGKVSTVDVGGRPIEGCRYAPGITGSLLGFKNVGSPTVGSQVLVLYGGANSYIIGTLSNGTKPTTGFYGSTYGNLEELSCKWKAFKSNSPQTYVSEDAGLPPSHDLLPGEMEMTSGTGPFIRMLYSLAQIGAGDLAKVEACMFNDMVRITDNYFAHHMCAGDKLVWSDGFCNSQEFITSYPHEADGKIKPDDKLFEQLEGIPDRKGIQDEYNETGRWRVADLKGYIADLVHLIVMDPIKTMSYYDKEGTAIGGKARMWVGANGMVMVQSCAAVHVEVTPKVVVPTQKYSWNHPERKNVDRQMSEYRQEFMQVWGSGPDWKDLKVACWQLQSYVKFLTLWQSLARFRQAEKVDDLYRIPTEAETPEPLPDCDDNRPGGKEGYKQYASFTMDGSGSITLCANGTTTVTMNQGNVQVACPGDFEIKAGGTVSISGANVALSATHRLEISSLRGMWIRARNWMYMLCEKGRLWLKSDARVNENPSENADLDDLDKPVSGHFGVVIDSTASGTLVHGAMGTTVAVTGTGNKSQDEQVNDLVLQNTGGGNVKVYASKHVDVMASQKVTLSTSTIITTAKRFFADFSFVRLCESFVMLGSNIFSRGLMWVTMLRTHSAMVDSGPQVSPQDAKKYDEALDKIFDMEHVKEAGKTVRDTAALKKDYYTYSLMGDELNNYKWKFCKWALNTGAADSFTSLKRPLYESTISWSKEQHGIQLEPVYMVQFRPEGGSRTDSSRASWPGNSCKMYYYEKPVDMPELGKDWNRQYKQDDIGGLGKMKVAGYSIHISKQRK